MIDHTVLTVEQELSKFLERKVEIDRPKFAMTRDIVFPESDLIPPNVPLDTLFYRIRVCRDDSTIDKFHLDLPAGQTVLAVDQDVSEFLWKEVEMDHTEFAVTPETVLAQSDLIIPIVPLA
jgi:hypothetical protein